MLPRIATFCGLFFIVGTLILAFFTHITFSLNILSFVQIIEAVSITVLILIYGVMFLNIIYFDILMLVPIGKLLKIKIRKFVSYKQSNIDVVKESKVSLLINKHTNAIFVIVTVSMLSMFTLEYLNATISFLEWGFSLILALISIILILRNYRYKNKRKN